MKFKGGQLKLTFNSQASHPNSVKFKEIILGDWDFILLSSYCTDYEWLLDQFDGISPSTEINIIEHYDKSTGHAGIQKVTAKSRTVNLIHPNFPKFPNYGVMHCKLIILASKDFMRIVVSSANLMEFDYDEVQNVVFVQDLPKVKEASLTASAASFLIDCQFYVALNRLLDALGVFNEKKVVMPMSLMQKYDWSEVKAFLVYSLPSYTNVGGEDVSGLTMLNNIVKDHLSLKPSGPLLCIEYQGSSIGVLKKDWLKEFGNAAMGKFSESSKFDSKKRSLPKEEDDVIDLTENEDENDYCVDFKVVFPTEKTVVNSLTGPSGFGTLFCKKKDFQSPNFPTEIFYNCTNDFDQCKYAMHSKIMTVSSLSAKKEVIEYVCCGSHNFTASAWGKTTKAGSMMMISNFEVGVIIPKTDLNLLNDFKYPYLRPPQKYSLDDLPWDQTDYFST